MALLRSMMGGATNPAAVDLSDDEVKAKTMTDLKQIMGIECDPDFVKIYRHKNAIPQYTRGHAQRLQAIEGAVSITEDLILTGNAFFGVGLNDCVNASNRAAEKVVQRVSSKQ